MSGTETTVFSVGEQYWCVDPDLNEPLLGTVIALTDEPGKTIGLEFAVDINGKHNCDQVGEFGRCIWTTPSWIYTPEEWAVVNQVQTQEVQYRAAYRGNNYTTMTVNSVGQFVSGDGVLPQSLEDGDVEEDVEPSSGPKFPTHKE